MTHSRSATRLGCALSALLIFAGYGTGQEQLPVKFTEAELRVQIASAEGQVAIKKALITIAECNQKLEAGKGKLSQSHVAQGKAKVAQAETELLATKVLFEKSAVSVHDYNRVQAVHQEALAQLAIAEQESALSPVRLQLETAKVALAQAELDAAQLRVQQLKAQLQPRP